MENRRLTLGSLFDGSGGFPLGGLISGITPLWASEIEPFPIRVTTKRMPEMKHYGDISKLNGGELEPVDIVTFGSPCQDMSIAGKRDGLGGSRSGLFYEATRIVKEMRCKTNGEYPRFVVWENVPGAFSSNKGEDFKAVLEEICIIKESVSVPRPEKWSNAGEVVGDGFSVAWRLFDAQFWGVPQRRKRIYLVADLAGRCAGKILFESEGLSGYTPQGFRPWQGAAGTFTESVGETGTVCLNDQGVCRMDVTEDKTCTLWAKSNHPPCVMEPTAVAVYENHSQDTRYTDSSEVAPTVLSTYGTGGNNQPFVVENIKNYDVRLTSEGTRNARSNVYETETARTIDTGGNAPDSNQGGVAVVAYGICSKDSNSMKSDNPSSGFYRADTSRTLDGNGGNPSCNQGGLAVVSVQGSIIGRKDENGPQGSGVGEDISFTLNATDKHAVAYSSSKASFFTNAEKELANTLVATDYKDPPIVNAEEEVEEELPAAEPEYIVRRLTPTECARLQGFPDWWCSGLGTEEPIDEEVAYWKEIFSAHAKAMEKSIKEKSDNQVRKWLQNPHSDSAEYKMWGNGVALPNVCFVLSGIVYYAQFPTE